MSVKEIRKICSTISTCLLRWRLASKEGKIILQLINQKLFETDNKNEEKKENAEKPPEKEIVNNESTEKSQPQPNIEKTEHLEEQQFETKNPDLQIPVVEVNMIKNLFPDCIATLVHNLSSRVIN